MQLVHSGNLAFELRLSGSQRAVKVGTFLRSEEGNRLRRGLAKLCLEVEDAGDAQEDKPWVRLEVGSEASGTPRAGRSFSVPEAWAKLVKPDGNSGAARVPTSPMRTPRAEDVAEGPEETQTAAPGGRPPPEETSTQAVSFEDRLVRAARIGRDAGRKLRGEIETVPPEQPLAL